MSIVSHLHQLFNAEPCPAEIHTGRWTDRSLQCPRCQRCHVGPWGTYPYQPGRTRYRGQEQDGQRPVNDLTGTRWDGRQRSVMYGILAPLLWCLSGSSRRSARELGVHVRPGYRWCWWWRHVALSDAMKRQWEGPVEADDLDHPAGHQGPAKTGGTTSRGRQPRSRRQPREPGRGHDDQARPAISAWVSRQGGVVIHATRDCTVKTVQKAADMAMQAGRRL
jgi:hypothetical protein